MSISLDLNNREINSNSHSIDREKDDLQKKREIAKTFWGLKENWWKQIFDGKFHEYGPLVFDLGLHKGIKETGYYRDAFKACLFTSDHLLEKVSVDFYKNLHKIVCAHFNGRNTEITAKDTGVFLRAESCTGVIDHLYETLPDEALNEILEKIAVYEEGLYLERYSDYCIFDGKKFVLKELQLSKEEILQKIQSMRDFHTQIEQKIAKINEYIAARSFSLQSSKPIAVISRSNPLLLHISYQCEVSEIESIVQRLFDEFYQNMIVANTEDAKIRCHADLYQMLEWLHSFADGQGRTDLILLSKLLCENGLNPPILYEPYVSTFCLLEDWVDYLKRGIELWRKEASAPGSTV